MLRQIVRPLYRQQTAERILPQLVDGPGNGLLRPWNVPVVPPHQRHDLTGGALVHPQAAADLLCQRRRHLGVSVKVSHTPSVHGKADGLPHVVKQHGPAQHRLRRNGRHGAGGVFPHVVEVVAVLLVKSHAGQQLRQEYAQHIGVRQQHRQHMRAAQQPIHLRQQPLGGDIPQQRGAAMQRGGGARLHGEAQHRGEPQRPHDAQGVLVKAPVRVSYAAQDAPAQIVPAAVQVGDISPHVHGHGVHRQIAARQILRQRVGKVHGIRAAVVGVGAVGTEGGDLHGKAVLPDGDGAMAQAGGDTVSRE